MWSFCPSVAASTEHIELRFHHRLVHTTEAQYSCTTGRSHIASNVTSSLRKTCSEHNELELHRSLLYILNISPRRSLANYITVSMPQFAGLTIRKRTIAKEIFVGIFVPLEKPRCLKRFNYRFRRRLTAKRVIRRMGIF
jgi:hypothetical protein